MFNRREAWSGLEGSLAHNARLYAGLGDRVNDWVAAAPIIALVQPVQPVVAAMKRWAKGGFRLNAVLRELGIPTCLKKLTSDDVMRTMPGTLPLLMALGNENLAQEVNKRHWADLLSVIINGSRIYEVEPVEGAIWTIKNGTEVNGAELDEIRDYFRQHGPQWQWSKSRILKEHKAWVRDMRTAKALKVASSPKHRAPIDLGGSPALIEVDGVTCRALVSTGQLIIEGARMQHCVGGDSFQSDLREGYSRFYHFENEDGESTVEFVRRGENVHVRQHYAEQNAKPYMSHKLVAEKLRADITVPKEHQGLRYFSHGEMVRREYDQPAFRRFFQDASDLGQLDQTITASALREQMERKRLMDMARQQQAMPPDGWLQSRWWLSATIWNIALFDPSSAT